MANVNASSSRVSSQPKLVSEMTAEEAERKRASDRQHQRHSRARKRIRNDELEAQNALLRARLVDTEEKLAKLQTTYDTLRAAVNAAHNLANPAGSHSAQTATRQSPPDLEVEIRSRESISISGVAASPQHAFTVGSSTSPSSMAGCVPVNPNGNSDFLLDIPIEFGTGLTVNFLTDNTSVGSNATNLVSNNFDPFMQDSTVAWADSWGTASQAMIAISPQSENTLAPLHPERAPIWQILPVHLPPSTPIDHVLIDVSESARKWSRQQGEPYEELSQQSFPSISSLLKPTTREETSNPVATAVGKHSTWGTTVISFPSRVAYHYIVAHLLRWMVCRTEESFNQIPDFLRPTEIQRTIPHPAWVDVFAWKEGRDLIIQYMDYSKFEAFRRLTEDFSVNWPYSDSDMFLSDSSKEHISLNPVFESHIRDGNNWTFNPDIAKYFPFMKSCPTVVHK